MNKSFVKWAGGKYDLLPTLIDIIQQCPGLGGRFIEPFVGGGALTLNIPLKVPKIINDVNPGLISVWIALESGEFYIDVAQTYFIPENNTEEEFYRIRTQFNAGDTWEAKRPYHFLYLNRHCFNGLCRYNKQGKFNVPYGGYKTIYFPEKELRHAMEVMKNTRVLNMDFADVMNMATEGDVVYCDPPYIPLSETSAFVGYSKGGFTMDDQIRLRDRALRLRDRGVTVIISNNDTPLARKLYAKADDILSVQVAKRISCKADGRKKQREVIAIYKP